MDTSSSDTNSAGGKGSAATASSASQRLSRVQRTEESKAGDEELLEGDDADAPVLSKAMSRASSTAASVLAAVTSCHQLPRNAPFAHLSLTCTIVFRSLKTALTTSQSCPSTITRSCFREFGTRTLSSHCCGCSAALSWRWLRW